ncbi:MAG: aminoacyl-tRNA hydrolase [Ignavibacteriae bacterium]|nr:aminoacyl-tRNA hydrolase [Ignavibacteriota bacterium]
MLNGHSTNTSAGIKLSIVINEKLVIPFSELRFVTSRSGGPGGQNVNKLETRVELLFDVVHSTSITNEQRAALTANLRSKMDADGVLRIVAQESRSQWQNKQNAVEKFVQLFRIALKPRKKRVATKPSRNAKEKRLKSKRIRSETKKLRKSSYD